MTQSSSSDVESIKSTISQSERESRNKVINYSVPSDIDDEKSISSYQAGNRRRMDSEDTNILAAAHYANNHHNFLIGGHGDPSDEERSSENGSIIFRYQRGSTPPATYDLPHKIARESIHSRDLYSSNDSMGSRERFPSMDSSINSFSQPSIHNIPTHYHVPKQKRHQTNNNRYGTNISNSQKEKIHDSGNDNSQSNSVLPYFKRKMIAEKERQASQKEATSFSRGGLKREKGNPVKSKPVHHYHQNNHQEKLSTISSPHLPPPSNLSQNVENSNPTVPRLSLPKAYNKSKNYDYQYSTQGNSVDSHHNYPNKSTYANGQLSLRANNFHPYGNHNQNVYEGGSNIQNGGKGYHIHTGSTGSVSSLGSAATGKRSRKKGEDIIDHAMNDKKIRRDTKSKPQQIQTQSSAASCLSSIVSHEVGSPQSLTEASYLSVEEETAHFHEKNQKFLKEAIREKKKQNNFQHNKDMNPKRRHLRSASPSPPSTRGEHRRGLSSINNDDWEEDDMSYQHNSSKRPHGDRGIDRLNKDNPPHQINFVKNSIDPFIYSTFPQEDSSKTIVKYTSQNGRKYESKYNENVERNYMERDLEGYSSNNSSTNACASLLVEDASSSTASSSSNIGSNISDDDDISYDEEMLETKSPLMYNERSSLINKKSGIKKNEYFHQQEVTSNSSRNTQKGQDDWKGKPYRDQKKKSKDILERMNKTRGLDHKNIEYYDKISNEKQRYSLYQSGDDSDILFNGNELRFSKQQKKFLRKEREKMFALWRKEMEAMRKREIESRWYNRFLRWIRDIIHYSYDKTLIAISTIEAFVSNLPLTIGAIAMAIVTLGIVWFKFAEENIKSCHAVYYHSSGCYFPEFPGCFHCNNGDRYYKIALNFHKACSEGAGFLAFMFLTKIALARSVVMDEMCSPTTSSPAGLICMTLVCVFAGRGIVGQIIVSVVAVMHLLLVIWFIYIALAYNILPDPSWYPNTIGIGVTAVKVWLYYPILGHFLMAISLSLNFFFFPVSLVRVFMNTKISAPVAWIQMSAPAVSLYSLTIMAQPSYEEELNLTNFQRVHRLIYLPCMHFLFTFAILGLLSSLQSLWTRWSSFTKKEFSPAHAAFCFPILAHANAIQAYRGAVDAFSEMPNDSTFMKVVYIYWCIILVTGTTVTVIITIMFMSKLPGWVCLDVADEIEPPAPNETVMSEVILSGQNLIQNFVSPAVLQANETGALVCVPGQGRSRTKYVRTRRVTALGFDPIMNLIELNNERDALLDMVAKIPPRARRQTVSVPGISNYHIGNFGNNNKGVYDSNSALEKFDRNVTRTRASDGRFDFLSNRGANNL
eukprot:CAMPEP_0184873264 /NCGR_PEP_ID=MMETSP0580-20130426/41744_1 /TAXON_ID=1118495 /ORGANISM="Dactyliosolen fragilissimus" /LENGTH=1321 /DNA_ID=CAMNT_0027376147 /DNA_START=80 /DNA_END=4045 /DNA_ORIENTATION=+